MSELIKELTDNGVKIDTKPPNILTITKYIIPEEYLKDGADKNKVGTCTPSSLKLIGNTFNYIETCPESVKVNQLKETIDEEYTTLATLNSDKWSEYLKNDDENLSKTKLCRYLLYSITNNPLNIYISEDELVRFNYDNGKIFAGYAKDQKNECYKFNPITINNYRDGINSGGKLIGLFGVCNDNSYKLHKFSRKIGIWILLGLILIFFGFLFYQWKSNKNKPVVKTDSKPNTKK
jgi:hypothetical protein